MNNAEERIRYPLKELCQIALITHNGNNDPHSMHPAGHYWARERPQMKRAAQVLSADLAGLVLQRSSDLVKSILRGIEHPLAKCDEPGRSYSSLVAIAHSSSKQSWSILMVPFPGLELRDSRD